MKQSLRYLLLLYGLVFLGFGISLDYVEGDKIWVVALMCSEVLVMGTFVQRIHAAYGRVPLLNIYLWCVLVTFFYSVIPLISFIVFGFQFNILNNNRLAAYNLTSSEMALYSLRYLVYMLSVVLAILWNDRELRAKKKYVRTIYDVHVYGNQLFFTVAGIVVCSELFFYLIQAVYGFSRHVSYDDITGQYNSLMSMPLMVRQLVSRMVVISLMLKFAMMSLVVLRARDNPKWIWIIAAVLMVEMLSLVFQAGSRTEFFLLLVATAVLYDACIKPIPIKRITFFGLVLMVGFQAYGIYRSMVLSGSHEWGAAGGGEFEAVFATGYDVYRKMLDGEITNVPASVYFSEIIDLIPQQLLPMEKIGPADWYLDVMGWKEYGTGLAFGVMSQVGVGFGYVELILRGLALGYTLTLLHRWFIRRRSFYRLWFYLWCCLYIYWTMRATTFYLVTLAVMGFLPAYLLVRLSEKNFTSKNDPGLHENLISNTHT